MEKQENTKDTDPSRQSEEGKRVNRRGKKEEIEQKYYPNKTFTLSAVHTAKVSTKQDV